MATSEPVAPAGAAPCQNCGARLNGPFCHRCGQRATDPIGPLPAVARDAAGAFLDLDRRVLGTFRMLLLRPGFLTEEYVQGRRRSWMRVPCSSGRTTQR